jgi:integrase
MGRRAHGDGSVFYDASRGKWWAVIEAGRDENGRRVRRKASAASKTEARGKLDELRDELRDTGTVAPRDMTVAQIMQDWIEHPPSSLRSPISLRVNRQYADRITAAIGTVPVAKLTIRQVEAMLQRMARDGLATSTIAANRAVLRRALRRAMRDGLVRRNVAELADAPRGTVRQSRSMTRAQIAQLLAQEMPPWWRAYLLTAIGCGLRPGELLGLKWEDIDMDAGTLRLSHALHEEPGPGGHGSRLSVASLKTQSSRRALRTPEATIVALRAHRADQAAARLKAGNLWQDHGLVFCGPAGKAMWPGGVRARFRRLCEQAGLGADWHPHEQRHTFVSVLSDAGETIERIAAAAGHKNSAITKKTYWHAISPEITTAATAMEGVLGAPPEGPS